MEVERDEEAGAFATKKGKKKYAQVRTEFRGVRQRGGKYRAQIWDSMGQTMTWLGSFDTAEEAARAHDAAAVKLYDDEAKTNFKNPEAFVSVAEEDNEMHPKKKKAPAAGKAINLEVQGGRKATTRAKSNSRPASRGVYLSGCKYVARIWDPVQRSKLWLGSFDTAEEAAGAHNAAALRLQAAAPTAKTKARSGFRGVYPRGSKYIAQIKDPVQRTKLRLGTFETPVEAARAYDEAAVRLYGATAVTNFEEGSTAATANDGAGAAVNEQKMSQVCENLDVSRHDLAYICIQI